MNSTLREPASATFEKFPIWQWLNINSYLVISYCLIFVLAFLKFPTLSYKAELWAELGNNFLFHALNSDTITNLETLDYNYLPFLPRLLSVILVKGLNIIDNFPFAAQLLSLSFIALFTSLFNLHTFKKVIPSNKIRFFLSLCFGLAADYDLYSFINFIYFGFPLCILILFIDKDALSNKLYYFLLMVCLLIVTSKVISMIFIPLYFIAICYHFIQKERKSVIFCSILLSGMLLELVIFALNFKAGAPTNTPKPPLFEFISHVLYSTWTIIISLLFTIHYPENVETTSLNFVFFIVIIGVWAFVSYRQFKANKKQPLILFACAMYLTIASSFLTISNISVLHWMERFTPDWSQYVIVPLMRWTFISYMSLFIALSSLLYHSIKLSWLRTLVVVYVGVYAFLFPFLDFKDIMLHNSHSNWSAFNKMVHEEDYYIPLNPGYPWALSKNTDEAPVNDIYQPALSEKLLGIMILNQPSVISSDLSIEAIDSTGKTIAKSERLNSVKEKTVFFYFPFRVLPSRIRYIDAFGNEVLLNKEVVKFIITHRK